ncbi:MAG: polysaccharide biosynthesis protein [Candidatus Accumulibacter sp.]|jgi:FlaA1/EpsC-like NDP-sugar epimerase|nr:polysaccharide biosynthesis protein [Accumulibacter sp.]
MFLNSLIDLVLALPRFVKRLVVLAVDTGLCVFCVWLAFYLRVGEFVFLSGGALRAALVSVAFALPVFAASGLYRAIFRYSGWPALMSVTKATLVYGLAYAFVMTVFGIPEVPRTIGLIQPILLLLFVGASRAFARFWLGGSYRSRVAGAALPKALIYGAGAAGRQLALAMANVHEMRVVGFLDDDERLHAHTLNGLPIYDPAKLDALVSALQISDILLAMPSESRHRRREILSRIRNVKVSVRTLPSVTELAQGKISVSDIRELDTDDLLGREPVTPNQGLLEKNSTGKVIVVTGAGGSIGSELCRQILALSPARLLLVDQSEFALYEIHRELEKKRESVSGGEMKEIVPLLASVGDATRMREIFSTWKPDIVYHAAAYKHVPLVEHNPSEGIWNNVFGTLTAARAACEQKVPDFVLISTDKAVRPTNVMGASKRLAEMILQALAARMPQTRLSMVRFGNVLGSSGSVVPHFRRQIREGGPITLTHTEITRFFMTIPEAAQLVIQAGAMAKGGDVFVLDMGKPVKIFDLARHMIGLSGLTVRDADNPDGDIAIEITGLRPGEKLYEELLIGDNPEATAHPMIMKAREEFLPWPVLEKKLEMLERAAAANDATAIRRMLEDIVSGYVPDGAIVDWAFLKKNQETEETGGGRG